MDAARPTFVNLMTGGPSQLSHLAWLPKTDDVPTHVSIELDTTRLVGGELEAGSVEVASRRVDTSELRGAIDRLVRTTAESKPMVSGSGDAALLVRFGLDQPGLTFFAKAGEMPEAMKSVMNLLRRI